MSNFNVLVFFILQFLKKSQQLSFLLLSFFHVLHSLKVYGCLFIFFDSSFVLLSALFIFLIHDQHFLYFSFRTQYTNQCCVYLAFKINVSFLLSFNQFLSFSLKICLLLFASYFVGKVFPFFMQAGCHIFRFCAI